MKRKEKIDIVVSLLDFLLRTLSYRALQIIADSIIDMVEDAVLAEDAEIDTGIIDIIAVIIRGTFNSPDERIETVERIA